MMLVEAIVTISFPHCGATTARRLGSLDLCDEITIAQAHEARCTIQVLDAGERGRDHSITEGPCLQVSHVLWELTPYARVSRLYLPARRGNVGQPDISSRFGQSSRTT